MSSPRATLLGYTDFLMDKLTTESPDGSFPLFYHFIQRWRNAGLHWSKDPSDKLMTEFLGAVNLLFDNWVLLKCGVGVFSKTPITYTFTGSSVSIVSKGASFVVSGTAAIEVNSTFCKDRIEAAINAAFVHLCTGVCEKFSTAIASFSA